MDQAALRERRAARERQVRRRRQALGAGWLVALTACVLALTAGGSDRPAQPRQAAPAPQQTVSVAVAPPPVAPPRTRPQRVAAMPGAHRAPHEAVPILMYHVIGTRGPLTTNPGLWVAPADFAAHMQALKAAGYHAVTLQQVWDAWHRRAKLPGKPLVISFDDGYIGHVRNALPTLAAAGWAGVLNLKLGNLADMGGTKAVRRLVDAGWEVGAHTINHPDLTTLGAEQLRYEIAVARQRLRRLFGVPVSFFCYPSGRYDATVIAAVKAAGYLGATTTQLGWASPSHDAYTLPRVRVDAGMSPADVLARLSETRAATPAGA